MEQSFIYVPYKTQEPYFCYIDKFMARRSLRKLGKFLGTSHSNVSRYLKLGAILTRNGLSYQISHTELDT